jgi:hypothetical protein
MVLDSRLVDDTVVDDTKGWSDELPRRLNEAIFDRSMYANKYHMETLPQMEALLYFKFEDTRRLVIRYSWGVPERMSCPSCQVLLDGTGEDGQL